MTVYYTLVWWTGRFLLPSRSSLASSMHLCVHGSVFLKIYNQAILMAAKVIVGELLLQVLLSPYLLRFHWSSTLPSRLVQFQLIRKTPSIYISLKLLLPHPHPLTTAQPLSYHCLSKIFERHVFNVLSNVISMNSILCNNRFEFRASFPTECALLAVTQHWLNTLESNKSIYAVFFDLSKAFDSVPRDPLLHTLCNLGLPAHLLCWFRSYLYYVWLFSTI